MQKTEAPIFAHGGLLFGNG